jgi:hypothetical protein
MRAASWQLLGVEALVALAAGCGEPRSAEGVAQGMGPVVWSGERQLEAGDAAEFDQLGYSVSLSDDRALVGAYGDDAYRGSAYVFVRSGSSWTEEQQLVASDGTEGDAFGYSVSLSDDRALVAAYGVDSYRGATYAFVHSGGAWIEEQKLVASDGVEGDNFGWSVSLAGERALVGAFARDSTRGAAYVFVRNGNAWTEEQELVASDGAEGDKLGYSVSLADERALVGAPGSDGSRGKAHVFLRNGSDWTEEQQLGLSEEESSDHLGVSVSLAGDRALLGSYGEYLRGAAHVFLRSGSAWTLEQQLVASDGASGHRFGSATSLRPDRALIGASGHDARGAAYVFIRSGSSSWTEEQTLTASDAVESDLFGWSVSLASDRALIGAHAVDNLRGTAYVYSLGLENGEPCSAAPDCASGQCVDDRCCDSDCTGACTACSLAEGASADGICTVIAQGSEGSPTCGTLACNGQSAECAPCDMNEDCSEARRCAADGTCQLRGDPEKAANGSFCASGETCASGHCADGVCCDAPCDGTCEACTAALKVAGVDGVCGTALDDASPVATSSSGSACDCPLRSATSVQGGGCACHAGGSPGRVAASWLGAALLLFACRRRTPHGSDPR